MDNNSRVVKPSSHYVLMNFMLRNGYHVSFLEENCKTTLPRKLTFATPDKILEMHERWGEDRSEDYLSGLKRDLTMGRSGGVWLILSEEQYRKLLK